MDIADDVERAALVTQVDPQGRPLNGGGVNLFGRVEHEHVPEALALQPAQRPPQLLGLLAHHPTPKLAVGTLSVAGQA